MPESLETRCKTVYLWMKKCEALRNSSDEDCNHHYQDGAFHGLRAALNMIFLGKRAGYDGTSELDAFFGDADDGGGGGSGLSGSYNLSLKPSPSSADRDIRQLLSCWDLNALRAREVVLLEMLDELKVNAEGISDAIRAIRRAIERFTLERQEHQGQGGQPVGRASRRF